VPAAENELKNGNTFLHWYNLTDNEVWVHAEHRVTKPITLIARWKVNDYNITFIMGGGTPQIEKQTKDYLATADRPTEVPTKEGYRFVGWFLDLEDEDEYDFSMPVKGHVSLSAKWMKVYVVRYFIDGILDDAETKIVDKDTELELFDGGSPDEGYELDGWYESSLTGTKWTKKVTVTNDIDFYGKWVLIKHKVTFNYMNGDPDEKEGTIKHERIEYFSKIDAGFDPKLEDELKFGHEFKYWYQLKRKRTIEAASPLKRRADRTISCFSGHLFLV